LVSQVFVLLEDVVSAASLVGVSQGHVLGLEISDVFDEIVVLLDLFVEFGSEFDVLIAEDASLLASVELVRGLPLKLAGGNEISGIVSVVVSSSVPLLERVAFGWVEGGQAADYFLVDVPDLIYGFPVQALLGGHHVYGLVDALPSLGKFVASLGWGVVLQSGWSLIEEALGVVSVLGSLCGGEAGVVFYIGAPLLVGKIVTVVHAQNQFIIIIYYPFKLNEQNYRQLKSIARIAIVYPFP
jgi:hypothetical protein